MWRAVGETPEAPRLASPLSVLWKAYQPGVEYSGSSTMEMQPREFVMGAGHSENYGSFQSGYALPRHGRSVEIGFRRGDRIIHLAGYTVTYPTVRSYADGVVVGCSFVTTEALERIYSWHKGFLGREESRTHQSGD